MKTLGTSIFHNAGDALTFIITWIIYFVTKNVAKISRATKKIPFIGRWLNRKIQSGFSQLNGTVLDLAISLTVGLLLNLVWDVVSACIYWSEKDKSKATLVPAPGPLNWIGTFITFVFLTYRRKAGASIDAWFFWSSIEEKIVAVIVSIIIITTVAFLGIILIKFLKRKFPSLFMKKKRRRR